MTRLVQGNRKTTSNSNKHFLQLWRAEKQVRIHNPSNFKRWLITTTLGFTPVSQGQGYEPPKNNLWNKKITDPNYFSFIYSFIYFPAVLCLWFLLLPGLFSTSIFGKNCIILVGKYLTFLLNRHSSARHSDCGQQNTWQGKTGMMKYLGHQLTMQTDVTFRSIAIVRFISHSNSSSFQIQRKKCWKTPTPCSAFSCHTSVGI